MFFLNLISVKRLTVEEIFNKYISVYSLSKKQIYLKKIYSLIPNEFKNQYFSNLKYLDWCNLITNTEPRFHKGIKILSMNLYDFYSINVDKIKNYGELLKINPIEQKRKRVPFSEWEIKQLWINYKKDKNIETILILIYTGMRISELINLKKEDIDFDKKVLVIKKSKTRAGTNRIIPLHKDIIPFLKHFTFNITYSSFSLKFKNIMSLLKMNHTIHECRHTFSTILSKTKARQHVIRAIMGHANNGITDLYIHIQLCDLIKTINLLQGKKIIESIFCKDDFYLR